MTTDSNTHLRLRTRILIYAAVWILALFATNPNGGLWSLAWMFPLGLAACIDRHLANDGGWWVFIACIAVYLVHGYFYFRSRTKRSTILFFGLLVLLLIANVSGCRAMLNTH